MGTFDPHIDSPDQVRQEGEELEIKFERIDASTGKIEWKIPPPADGCTVEHQAYCGIVLLLNTVPNQPVTTWPTAGERYVGDPTGDPDLHAGDKIGGALVVGAFYDDKKTVSLTVTGLTADQTYFVTGHITSCGLVYHRQGMSTYSLPYLYTEPTPDTSAYHEIVINESGEGVNGTDATGLAPGTTYCMEVAIDSVPYALFIDGTDAQTYDELVAAINKELKLLDDPPQGPVPPNTGAYWYDAANGILYQWDGFQHNEICAIVEALDPTDVQVGEFWLDKTTNLLYERVFAGSPPGGSPRTAVWELREPIPAGYDPASPPCDSFWFDNDDNQAYKWDGSVWCTRPTIIQTTDPSCAPVFECGTYWYDETQEMLFEWDTDASTWIEAEAIVWPTDPTAPAVGTFWFNDTSSQLFQRTGPGSPQWLELMVTVSETAPSPSVVGDYWFQPSSQELFRRVAGSPEWLAIDVLIWGSDPSMPGSCDLWWNTTTDELFTRDTLDDSWELVQQFFIQTTDPSLAPVLEIGTVWVDDTNPLGHIFWEWDGSQFVQIPSNTIIEWPTDPVASVAIGSIWFNTTTNEYLLRISATAWSVIDPIECENDPTMLPIGAFWFDTSTNTLNMWNGVSWVNVAYSTNPLTPSLGALWFNTDQMELFEWNGTTYVVSVPKAIATLNDIKGRCNPEGNIVISSTSEGCESRIVVGEATQSGISRFTGITYDFAGDLFDSLTFPASLKDPVAGTDGLSGISMYDEIGVGTDGNPAMRRELMDSIRKQLGYPTIEVELTKFQMNEAIQSALEEFRLRSATAYRRVFFFLNGVPRQQRYILTNECVGFNKIVQIQGIHRVTSSFMSTAYASGVYGQTTLQHMYHMGTFDLISYHIISDYIEQLEQMFATRIVFTWNEATRELFIPQIFTRPERLLVDATIERTEQEILTSRWSKTWIERWALAQCRLTLAETRGKYTSLPGAGGGVTLNAGDLVARAEADMQMCLDDIDNFVVNDIENLGIGSEVIIG